jgi:hypothetical protein
MPRDILVLLADGSRISLHRFAFRFGKQLISTPGARPGGGSNRDSDMGAKYGNRRRKSA